METVVKDFLAKVKSDKVEQMMGIALDMKYWTGVIGTKDVDSLRTKLSKEQEKVIKNRNGTVHSDNRNMDKINELNVEINRVEKAVTEMARLVGMKKDIELYMVFVNKPTPKTIKELEEIAKI